MLQMNAEPVVPPRAPASEFDRFRKAWAGIGIATAPAKRKEAEAAIRTMYRAAGLDAPHRVVWCGSPVSMSLARAIMIDPEFIAQTTRSFWKQALNAAGTEFKNNIEDSFRSSMRLFDAADIKQSLISEVRSEVRAIMTARMVGAMPAAIRPTIGESVWESAWQSVWDGAGEPLLNGVENGMRKTVDTPKKAALEAGIAHSLRDCVGDNVKAKVWEGLMDQAWANIRNGISSKIRVRAWEDLWKSLQTVVWEHIARPIGEQINACGNDGARASGYGQHDAYWLSFYAYFREAHGLKAETEAIAGLLELAGSAGWFAPHARLCWVCERPTGLSLDLQGRLHASSGPALTYPDGWQLHATHGVMEAAAGHA